VSAGGAATLVEFGTGTLGKPPGAGGGATFDAGGRGGAGRLRLATPGGEDGGRTRCGGGGGKLRGALGLSSSRSSSSTSSSGFGAAAGLLAPGAGVGAATGGADTLLGRDGAAGGTEFRGRGGNGFLEVFASSAIRFQLTPSLEP
jgi:hypothetical protein